MLYKIATCPQQLDAKNKDGILYTWSAGSLASGPTQSLTISPAKSFTGVAAYSPVTQLVYIGNPRATGTYSYGLLAFRTLSNCTLTLAWQRSVGIINQNDTNESVVIANGVAYFTNGWGKQVYAINAQTGVALWNSGTTITNYTFSAPTIDGGRLYVASYDNNLYAFGL
jgi:hypothetical protein